MSREADILDQAVALTPDREIVIKRTLDAPRELVFAAWTDLKHLPHWYGPNGFTTTIHEMDLRPGGVWRLTMHGPDGRDYTSKIVFSEVVRPERLVYRHSRRGRHRAGDAPDHRHVRGARRQDRPDAAHGVRLQRGARLHHQDLSRGRGRQADGQPPGRLRRDACAQRPMRRLHLLRPSS